MKSVDKKITNLADELKVVGNKISGLINEGCEDTYNCLVLQAGFNWIKLKIAILETFKY